MPQINYKGKIMQYVFENKSNWLKQFNESFQKNEDSNVNPFIDDVEGIIERAKEAVLKRLRYRFIENVSYFGSEATEKEEEVKFQVEESMKNLISELYNIVG